MNLARKRIPALRACNEKKSESAGGNRRENQRRAMRADAHAHTSSKNDA